LTDHHSAGTDGPGGHERPRLRPRARTLRVVTAVLVLALVVAVVASVVLAMKARADDETQKERAAASNVATQFALRMDAVDGTAFDKYTKGIDELLTTKAKTKNKEVFSAMKQSYEAAKIKGTGKVLLSGVGDFDDDSATVLVVHDASVTTTQGDVEHHYRWTVDVVKVGGSWLVDDFDPVN
jgi:Mce-associated membrane protein